MIDRDLIQDRFKQYYQLSTGSRELIHPQAELVRIFNYETAFTFVRGLRLSECFWLRILNQLPERNISKGINIHTKVSQAIANGKIVFFKMPILQNKMRYVDNDVAYLFLQPPLLTLSGSDNVAIKIESIEHAKSILNNMHIKDNCWGDLLYVDSAAEPVVTNANKQVSQNDVVSQLVAGELIVYKVPYFKKTPKKKGDVVDIKSKEKKTSLGPHVEENQKIKSKIRFLFSS